MKAVALAAALAVVAASLGIAPLQCAHDPDPNARREETADDALWALAQDFHAKHDVAGERATLKFLVERYPSSRHAFAAKEALARGGETDNAGDGERGGGEGGAP